MKLPPFEYARPDTVEQALDLLAEHGEDAKVLAGGQSLLPLLALRLGRPAVLIDINNLDVLGELESDEGVLEVGAIARHRAVLRDTAESFPLLSTALRHVGHDAIRTRGTIGGSIAHADASAELPMVALALGAVMHVASHRGVRAIAAQDFFEGFLSTTIAADELLIGVGFPELGPRDGWSFKEISRRSGDFAIVGCTTIVRLGEDGAVADARVVLSGVGDVPFRATDAEAALIGSAGGADACAAAGDAAAAQISPTSDLHGSAAFRRHLTRGLVRGGAAEALARAAGGGA